MKTVNHIFLNKSNRVFTVGPTASVLEALEMMKNENVSALLVMDGSQLKGIFTERDYARKVILKGKSSQSTMIHEVMTTELVTVQMNTSIDHCMQIMTEKHIRHLPIVENSKVSGLISIGDLVKFVIEDQKQTIEKLQNYISS